MKFFINFIADYNKQVIDTPKIIDYKLYLLRKEFIFFFFKNISLFLDFEN